MVIATAITAVRSGRRELLSVGALCVAPALAPYRRAAHHHREVM
jgi:hypothetical protein